MHQDKMHQDKMHQDKAKIKRHIAKGQAKQQDSKKKNPDQKTSRHDGQKGKVQQDLIGPHARHKCSKRERNATAKHTNNEWDSKREQKAKEASGKEMAGKPLSFSPF